MTASEFNNKLVDILGGDEFLCTDMIWQEKLFEMQDALVKLIVEGYNEGNVPLARTFVRKCPVSFQVEKVK